MMIKPEMENLNNKVIDENDYIFHTYSLHKYFKHWCTKCEAEIGYRRKRTKPRLCQTCKNRESNAKSLVSRGLDAKTDKPIRPSDRNWRQYCTLTDMIILNDRKHYRSFCPICNADKGYQFPQNIGRLCATCTCKRATTASVQSAAVRRLIPKPPDNTSLFRQRVRCRVKQALIRSFQGKKIQVSTEQLIGCSIYKLRIYLQMKFIRRPKDSCQIMTWSNYGLHGWHIDHIRPLCSFDLNDPKQFKEACHYTNLQPLWAEDNLRKGGKYVR